MKKSLLVAALFAGCAMLAFGQADRRPALGILPFTSGDDGEAIATLISMQPEILNAFAVLPRTAALNAIFAEHYAQLAGLTDSDAIAGIGRALNADYVISGSIRRLGDRYHFISAIVSVETFAQVGGYHRAFRTIEEVPGFLPSMSRNTVEAALGRDAARLPSLAMLPLSLAAGIDPRDAETLSMILAIEILNAGEHVLLPRTSAIHAALAGTDPPGQADDAGLAALGRAIDADFVLSGGIHGIGALSVFAARVLRATDGVAVAGATGNFALAEGADAMTNIAAALTGGDARAADQVAAQREPRERRETDIPANWLSLQVGFPWPAAVVQYERRLTESFALGAMLFEGPRLLEDGNFGGLAATARFFPLRWLYLELGAGLGWLWEDGNVGNVEEWGASLVPSIGARFSLGPLGGFFVNPFVSAPLVFSGSGVTPSVWGGIGVGYAWGALRTAEQVADGAPGRAPREPRVRREMDGPVRWISGEVSYLGAGFRYDRSLNEFFSLGVNLFGNFTGLSAHDYLLAYAYGLVATARFFPLARMEGFFLIRSLYLELGVGAGYVGRRGSSRTVWVDQWDIYSELESTRRIFGFMLAPAVGWRIDVGRPGGFFINPFVSFPIAIGNSFVWSFEEFINDDGRTEYHFPGGAVHHIRVGIGFGRAF